MIIGVTGTSGAGKDTVADYLVKKGYTYFSCSNILRGEAKKLGLNYDRDTLIKLGNKLRAQHGADYLARKCLEKIHEAGIKNAVVVSIRNSAEVKAFKEEGNFILICVDAPIEIRYKRIKKRNRSEDKVSLKKFKEQEEKELRGSETHQQLQKVMNMADFRVINDGSIKELYKKIDEITS